MPKALGPIWAAVPVKAFDQAKTRLSAALSSAQREGLARAMLTDVLCALGQSKAIERVMVITADSEVADLARGMGAEILHDRLCRGQTQAVEQAASAFAARGCAAMLTLPGDLPLLTPKDVDDVCALLCESTPLVMVPASGDGGTNAVLCCPPDSMQFHFGEDSFRKHLSSANALGLAFAISNAAGFQLDLDRPADLEAFLAEQSQSRSAVFLSTHTIKLFSGEALGSVD